MLLEISVPSSFRSVWIKAQQETILMTVLFMVLWCAATWLKPKTPESMPKSGTSPYCTALLLRAIIE